MTARDVQLSLLPDLVPERPQGWIMPSVFTGTNADLIAAEAPMYLTGRSVLDVTYGGGRWWDRYRPDPFTWHDLIVDGVDFRQLPETDASVDVVTFDPPYVTSGPYSSDRIADPTFHARYGIGGARSWPGGRPAFDAMLRDGLAEAARVARRLVLVKCMEFAAGALVDVPYLMRRWAEPLGLRTHDVIVHHTGCGPGGHNINTPVRARRHHSYLLVFSKAAA
jgi:hypothetical protein